MDLLERIAQKMDAATRFQEKAQAVVDTLHQRVEHFSWVGMYAVEGDRLTLLAWNGPQATEHASIPIGEGICGLAVREGRTVNVPDVNADSRYLACFPQTRSEVVIPIRHQGVIVGEIDIDSDQAAAFSDQDISLLEQIAEHLGNAWDLSDQNFAED